MDQQATALILISVAAFLLPLVADRLRLPGVVLEILFGILVGPAALDLVQSSELLRALAQLGFFLLMFLSGFEIDFNALRRQGPQRLVSGFALFGTTLIVAYLFSRLLGQGVFMTLVLATTSVGLVVPTLRGTRRTATALGQAILIGAILADFLTLAAVTTFAVIVRWGAGPELLRVPAFFLASTAILLALRRAAWWYPDRFERFFRAEDPEELGTRASLALMLTFVGLSSLFRIEPVLGAFLAGSVFALVFRHRGALERKLSGFAYGFFIPIFFIHVGITFDLRALLEPRALLLTAGLMAAAVAVKILPALALLAPELGLRQAIAAGTLLSARLSLIIAVAELGVELGLIDRTLEAGAILLAIVSSTVAPTVFRLLAPPLSEA